jgi:deoxyribonuclease I
MDSLFYKEVDMRHKLTLILILVFAFLLAGDLFAQDAKPTCLATWKKIQEQGPIPAAYRGIVNLCDDKLIDKLRAMIGTNSYHSYSWARETMMTMIDNQDGELCSVYGGGCIVARKMPKVSEMSCEHTWPQSLGATGIAKSDLHHLFPVTPSENSRRSNNPFCMVEQQQWSNGDSRSGKTAGIICFEPPVAHRGDVARAMFYFAIRYQKAIDPFQEKFLRQWAEQDAVSSKEVRRNDTIESYQGNRNPFIDIPGLWNAIADL